MSLTKEGAMTVVEFIKNLRKESPDLQFRVRDHQGRVYKSKGWEDYENKKDTTRNTKK